jgi:predicted ATP-binding protein involved in virulence
MARLIDTSVIFLSCFDEDTKLQEYFPEKIRFVIFTGENGSGKTAFLKAISEAQIPTKPIFICKDLFSSSRTEQWLYNLTGIFSEKRCEEIRNVIAKLVPNYEKLEKYCKERCELNRFSDGQRQIMYIIVTMLMHLYSVQYNRYSALAELKGIVLIDDIDIYLSPVYQKEFPRLLAELFPNIQFIVTTNSANTFLGIPHNAIAYNVTNDVGQEITGELINIDFANLMPNILLSSPLFNLDIIPTSNTNTNQIATTDTYSEHVAQQKLTEKLHQLSNKLNERK